MSNQVDLGTVEFLATAPNCSKEKEKFIVLFITCSIKRCMREFTVVVVSSSRLVPAKKCTKKCYARAELLFYLTF